MRIAYLDCIGGIAGDMMLAALIEAGLSEEPLLHAFEQIPLKGWQWHSERVEVGALQARRVEIQVTEPQPHRTLPDVLEVIKASPFSEEVQQRAAHLFELLAQAEAKVHGTTPDQVHFHEVGAVDAILEVLGTCWGLEQLGVKAVYCSPLPMGRGFVQVAHGTLPLPAPATVELLRGIPTYGLAVEGETVTPTGAALVATLATQFGVQPPMRWQAIGYGAGHTIRPLPNLLRVFLGERVQPEGHETVPLTVVQLETNLDNASPELLGWLMEQAFDAGALDLFFTPIFMKKNRPGVLVTLLAELEHADALAQLLLKETPTLGVRMSWLNRYCLEREWQTVQTPYGSIRVKLARQKDRILHWAPEYEDCRRAAQEHKVPLQEVMEAVRKHYPHPG